MNNVATSDPQLVTLSAVVYKLLLIFYPTRFRQEYGPHMAQVFRDSCLKTYCQSGMSGFVLLWALTLFDWFKTVIEEQTQRGTEMTRTKFIRLRGWALMLAAIFLIAGFGIGGGEKYYSDPLGGSDGFYEYSQLILIPTSMLLFTIGIIGLRLRYGAATGRLGSSSLVFAAIAGGLSFLVAIPLFALMKDFPWMGGWWYVWMYSWMVKLVSLSLFGIAALRTKPLPRWNALPLLTGVWFALVFIIGTIVEEMGGNADALLNDYMAFVAMLFMIVGSMVLGYFLQKDLPSKSVPA